MAIFNGTPGDDTLSGTSDDDLMTGLDGNDTLNGLAGNDELFGGGGDDTLNGGGGDDEITGGAGANTLNGGGGDDLIHLPELDSDFVDMVDGGLGFDTVTVNLTNFYGNIDLENPQSTRTYFAEAGLVAARLQNVERVLHYNDEDELVRVTYLGSDGDDVLNGVDETAPIYLHAGLGNDTVVGGASSDYLYDPFGETSVVAGASNDSIFLGMDLQGSVAGGGGYDYLYFFGYFNEGERALDITLSDTMLSEANGGTTLSLTSVEQIDLDPFSGDFMDTIDASAFTGAVNMETGGGNDTLIGGIGSNELQGENGADTMTGGGGLDTFYIAKSISGMNGDVITDFDEDDVIRFGNFSNVGVFIGTDEFNGVADELRYETGLGMTWFEFDEDGDGIVDASFSITNGEFDISESSFSYQNFSGTRLNTLTGTGDDDVMTGTDANETGNGFNGDDDISAGGGDDVIGGGGGNDLLKGDDGNDTLNGGGGIDTILGGAGEDLINGGLEGDILRGGGDNDTVNGQAGNDDIIGGGGDDTLNGAEGNDVIDGSVGNDVINGGVGNDTLSGGSGDDELLGVSGNDTMYGGDGDDVINGAGGSDTLSGEDGSDTLSGGLNGDDLFGGAGDDDLSGQAGGDRLYGQAGNDLLKGAAGADSLFGATGDDTLNGGAGNDVLDGGEGDDTFLGLGGLDTYVFDADQTGNDNVIGFEAGETIELKDFGYANESEAADDFSQILEDVVFDNGAGILVTFQNATLSDVIDAISLAGNSAIAQGTESDAWPMSDEFAFFAGAGRLPYEVSALPSSYEDYASVSPFDDWFVA